MTDPPELILRNIYEPTGNSLLVAQALKDAALAAVPAIFITARKTKSVRERAEELKAVGCLENPFDQEKPAATISRALQSRHSTIVNDPSAAPKEGITE
jgi:CheY-like chemotaxis protein